MEAEPTVPLSYLLLIVIFLLGGAYFAICETAFASVNEIRLITYSDDDYRAKLALKIKENFDSILTTILIGNNIMHIGCSSTATVFVEKMWGNTAVSISTFVITFIVFIFAEMIPKAYANACNEKICLKFAKSLNIVNTILTPLTFVFKNISILISKLFNTKTKDDTTLTEEELFDIIESIDEEDPIEVDEAELVKSALELTEKTALSIITPIDKVSYIKTTMTDDEIEKIVFEGNHTRLPVIDENDDVIGIIQIRKYLKAKIKNNKTLLNKRYFDKVVYVDINKPIDELLDYMSLNRTHMAFVKDKNDKVIGILTIEDILEELVGEIHDEREGEK